MAGWRCLSCICRFSQLRGKPGMMRPPIRLIRRTRNQRPASNAGIVQTALAPIKDGPKTDAAEPKSKRRSAASAKPLLLLDDGPEDDPTDRSGADNSRCEVCHLNLAREELAVTHARKGIGYAKCHGECDAHIEDESWASGGPGTAPEIMYPPERIDRACEKCHESHDVSPEKVIQRLHERCPQKARSSKIVCTDCHGKHRLKAKLRKAWWDKKTGRPIKPGPANQRR